MTKTLRRVVLVAGTRPEAIKLAPVMLALEQQETISPILLNTGQHYQAVNEHLAEFGLKAEEGQQPLHELTSDLPQRSAKLGEWIATAVKSLQADGVVVQGDTSSAAMGAVMCTFAGLPVFHVEAGLRSGHRRNPFPEEINRRIITQVAERHYVPTKRARQNLIAEGMDESSVILTGNTVVDALRIVRSDAPVPAPSSPPQRMLLTCHRRENWGADLSPLLQVAKRYDMEIVWSGHRNARVTLDGDWVRALSPKEQTYRAFLDIALSCDVWVTDSGGLIEEGATLGRPCFILRDCTERREAVDAGAAVMLGCDIPKAAAELDERLDFSHPAKTDGKLTSIFGDGYASERIAADVARFLTEPVSPVASG